MTWLNAMHRDAVARALPGWEWRDDDVAEVEVDWDEGSYVGTLTIRVAVERQELASLRTAPGQAVWGEWVNDAYAGRHTAHPEERGYVEFDNGEAADFFRRLTERAQGDTR